MIPDRSETVLAGGEASPKPSQPLAPSKAATVQRSDTALDECTTIALRRDVLEAFAAAIRRCGVVGEERLAKLLYLALTSRLLPHPVSVAVKGPSSGGKSHTVKSVLGFFPSEAYHELTAMSERALVYSEEPLRHRFLVLYEAAGMRGDFAEYLIRSLLSEGQLRYETVERTSGGSFGPRLIEREGPTGLVVTTTLASMHPENETRYLSLTVADSPEQTQHILRALAEERAKTEVDLVSWQAFQRWLASQSADVTIPYARSLVSLIPPVAVRLRRDVGKLLTLIRAHALIHRTTRKTDLEGRLVAELRDYRAVHGLTADLIADQVGATVPRAVRETVAAVAELSRLHSDGVSNAQVAGWLALDKSAASRRVGVALQKGYLQNLEVRKGMRSRLVVGDPLPEEQTVLPSPDDLEAAVRCCTVAPTAERST